MLALAVGFAFTVMFFVSVTDPHEPPLVVNVNVILPLSDAPAVYVALATSVAFVQDPAPPLHVPPVAPPPTDPPMAADVAPWHIADNPPPALAVGFAFTVMFFVSVTDPHEPPLVVNVNVILPLSDAPAVYVALATSVAFVQDPAPPLHVPPVAPPPTDPPMAADVAPWHIADNPPPALAVGF